MLKAEDEAKVTGRPLDDVKADRKATKATLAWLRQQVQALGQDPILYTGPAFGTPEWLVLPVDNPCRAAAVLLAAKAWLDARAGLPEQVLIDSAYLARLGELYAETSVADANELARSLAPEIARRPTYDQLTARRLDHRSYGDVLGRPADQPGRDEVRATEGWTPVAIPGRPGWYRHWQPGGGQLDTQSYDLEPGSDA